MIHRILAAIPLAALLGATVQAQMFVPTGRDTLRGLPGVEIAVEPLPPELAGAGLDARQLRADVEQRLRASAIPVYASQAENPSPAKPYLYVHLSAIELPGRAGYAVGLQLHLRQTLRSPVTGSNIVNAMTWDAHTVLGVPRDGLAAVRQELRDYVDLFVRDWRASHP